MALLSWFRGSRKSPGKPQCPLLLLIGCLFPLLAQGGEFQITYLKCGLDREGAHYVANVNIQYTLSKEVREAVENGVPLKVDLSLRLRDDDAHWWDADRHQEVRSHSIHYHALARMYQVSDATTSYPRVFATLDAALNALGRIEELPVIRRDALAKGHGYTLSLQAELDLDALPLPLRPMAYLSNAWKLHSKPATCSLIP